MSNFPPNPHRPIPDGEVGVNIYGYVPSLGLAITATVLFFLLLVAHTIYAVKPTWRHTRSLQILLAVGCVWEVIGYGVRTSAHYNPFVLVRFVLPYFFVVCAPVFFSAAIYLVLSILINSHPSYAALAPLAPKKTVGIFVTFDVVTIIIQIVGAALIGVTESNRSQGDPSSFTPAQANDIVIAGLAIQTASFLVFIGLFATFLVRAYRSDLNGGIAPIPEMDSRPTPAEKGAGGGAHRPDALLIIAVSLAAFLVFLRTVFRLSESSAGVASHASTTEGLFGGLETAPVLAAVLILALVPVGSRIESVQANRGH